MLLLLAYLLGTAGFLAFAFCLALGLLKICDFIEEAPNVARRIGMRLTMFIALVSVILTFTDGLSYWYLISSLISHLAALSALNSSVWPARMSRWSLVSAFISPLIVTGTLFRHFHLAKAPLLESKAKWPGGRLDWDTIPDERRQYNIGEELTCLFLCWLPALWLALGAIAESWDLPSTSSERRSKKV